MNNSNKVFLLTFVVIAMLLGLSMIPQSNVFGLKIRQIDMLSDVHDEQESTISVIDEYEAEGKVATKGKPEYKDFVPEGMVPIEDYAPSDNREMDKLYRALDDVHKRNVRIMFFGDSFIEGDILTQEFRERLQQQFGGKGVGFVDITSITSAYRQSILSKDEGWDSHHANDRSGFEEELQGFNAKYFVPKGRATVQFTCPKNLYPDHLSSFSQATIYFTPHLGTSINATVNDGEQQKIYSYTQDDMGKIVAKTIAGDIKDVKYSVAGGPKSRFYGVALEDRVGISVDNMSLRGSSGKFLSKIPLNVLEDFQRIRPYDLIIILYGLNVAANTITDYTNYIDKMRPAIRNFNKAYPNASILLVGVSDRDEKGSNGKMRTMEGIKNLVQYQRKLAKEEHVAFWDLRMAMGGDLAITKMHEKGMARADYVHINFDGGKFIAGMLFDVLMNGKKNYDERKKNNQ